MDSLIYVELLVAMIFLMPVAPADYKTRESIKLLRKPSILSSATL
jgi:hypothetical protein